jgi:DNA-binding CsgD family transcriptional regulator
METRFASDLGHRFLAAKDFEGRWAVMTETLGALGATAVNAAALDATTERPIWFRTSLSKSIVSAYLGDGFHSRDFIVQHAGTSRAPLIWATQEAPTCHVPACRGFSGFVRDSGHRAIVSVSMPIGDGATIAVLTYCSEFPSGEVLGAKSRAEIERAIRLMLPWLGWPERFDHEQFLPLSRTALSRREAEVLTLLAGGMLNARIADTMGISEATVAKHLISARRKLGARTREQALARAIRARHIAV